MKRIKKIWQMIEGLWIHIDIEIPEEKNKK